MARDDDFLDIGQESGDSDDLEILEVVGVEDEAQRATPPSAPPVPEEDPDEYVLDFDSPEEEGILEPASRGATAAEPAGEADDTDRSRLLRLRADYDNLRKRIEREREDFELYANFALVGRLLPVLDNLERALSVNSLPEGEGLLREGLIMIHRQLTDQLQQEGLRIIASVGETFDPNLHDAVATDPASEHPPNTVVEELQKGYVYQDRVLRPAMVKVSTGSMAQCEDN